MATIASSRLHIHRPHLHLSPHMSSALWFILASCVAIGAVVWLAVVTAGGSPTGIMMMMH